MASPKQRYGFGYRWISMAMPSLKFDLEQLLPKVLSKGSIDDVAIELEVMGSGNATAIRTAALRAVGESLLSMYQSADPAIRLMRAGNPDLAKWASIICAREIAFARYPEVPVFREAAAALERGFQSGRYPEFDQLDARLYSNSLVNGQQLEGDALYYCAMWVIYDNPEDFITFMTNLEFYEQSALASKMNLLQAIAEGMPAMPVRVR